MPAEYGTHFWHDEDPAGAFTAKRGEEMDSGIDIAQKTANSATTSATSAIASASAASTAAASASAAVATEEAARKAEVAESSRVTAVEKAANYELAVADAQKCIEGNKATTIVITVPTNATAAFPVGSVVELYQMGAGTVEVVAAGGVTIRTPTGTKTTRAQFATIALRKRATDEWVLSGDLT